MKNINPFARNLLILALIALAVVVLDQEVALSVVGALVRVAFFIAIAVVAYFFWRDFGRREIAVWPGRAQAVIYGAIALLVVDLGVWLSTSPNGREALALIVVAAISVYAGVRTWLEQRRVL
jgi:peptidoglycan/LPS O-acetylase OafA/YrhL